MYPAMLPLFLSPKTQYPMVKYCKKKKNNQSCCVKRIQKFVRHVLFYKRFDQILLSIIMLLIKADLQLEIYVFVIHALKL